MGARAKNEDLWGEVFDLPLFQEGDPNQSAAWKWAEKLADSGRLRRQDIFALIALLQAASDFVPESKRND